MDSLDNDALPPTPVPTVGLRRASELRAAEPAVSFRPPPGAAELFDNFCAENARDLAFKLAAPRASMLWADASRRDEVLSVAGEVEGLIGRVLARADRAWARVFEIHGKTVSFGRGVCNIDWQLDPVSGKRFDAAQDALAIGLAPEGMDPRGAWALGRFEQAIALGQGVWISPSEEDKARYAHEFSQQVVHFQAQNPVGKGVQWACPLEVALRATNLSLGFLMLRHRPELQDGQFAVAFASLVAAHGRFLESARSDSKPVPTTHDIARLVGLMHLGVIFPELPGARGWKEAAKRGLAEAIQQQVLRDGFSDEGSITYHRLALELFTLGLFAAHAGKVSLGQEYIDRLQEMFRAVRVYLTPGLKAPNFGDNDGRRAFAFADRSALDHGYLLPLGAALYLDEELRTDGQEYCDEALFLMGPAGLGRFRRLPESMPPRSGALARAGLYFVRSGQAYCAVSAGANGKGGHSHNDKLGVEIHVGAKPIVVDTGTYSYADPVNRNAFRATSAHSTVEVDGIEQSRLPETRLFELPDDARAKVVIFESTPARERFVGEHKGYERLVPPVHHRREVIYERAARAFVIHDRMTGSGAHEVVSRLQLPDRLVRTRAATEGEKTRLGLLPTAQAFQVERVFELGPEDAPTATLIVANGAADLLPSWYSPAYGVRHESYAVEVKHAGDLPALLSIVLLLHT